jgi:hypothetical protein
MASALRQRTAIPQGSLRLARLPSCVSWRTRLAAAERRLLRLAESERLRAEPLALT